MSAVNAKVVKAFSDADDLSKTYAVGDRFSGSAERVESLEKGGYVATEKPPRAAKGKTKE